MRVQLEGEGGGGGGAGRAPRMRPLRFIKFFFLKKRKEPVEEFESERIREPASQRRGSDAHAPSRQKKTPHARMRGEFPLSFPHTKVEMQKKQKKNLLKYEKLCQRMSQFCVFLLLW